MTEQTPTDTDLRERLSSEQYEVTQKGGTERPFSGDLLAEKRAGIYHCVCCGVSLFHAGDKFDSGTGWPSFTQPAAGESVDEHSDRSLGAERTEVRCAGCSAHLGHVFPDGPEPTGLRYCMNSAALDFESDQEPPD